MVNLSNFDLNLLRVLDALLREGSTVRAAARLGLSQPAVSAALRRLRLALGDELFVRRGQGIEPTQFALQLQAPLRNTLEGIEVILQGAGQFDPATSDARFRIAGSDFFAEMLMPQLADRLSVLAPGIRIHLLNLVTDGFEDTLERSRADLAVAPRQNAPDWVHRRPVFRSGFSVVARADHPAVAAAKIAPGSVMPLALFCGLGHVVFSPEGNAAALGDAALAEVGRTRRVVMTMPVFSGVYRAVAGSDLIALLPTRLACHVAGAAGLRVYRAPIPVPVAQIDMIWHQRFTASPAHVWLRDLIADLLAPLDEAEG